MTRRPLRIGFAGPVLETSSGHAGSIARAIAIARSELAPFASGHAELIVADDGASAAGGRTAAQLMLQQDVDVIAGFYASSSAAAAISLLHHGGIPVIVAGANADDLTASAQVYRTCDTATDYAAWIAQVLGNLAVRDCSMLFEPSAFGQSIERVMPPICDNPAARRGRVIACIGQFEFADRVVRDPSTAPGPGDVILLTDDCQSDRKVRSIAAQLPGTEIYVAGFSNAPAPGRTWARDAAARYSPGAPAAFFHETIAALEVALQLALHGNLAGDVATVLGDLKFDCTGEARPRRMALYRATGDGLVGCSADRAKARTPAI
jgi:Periplasmic binding protein